MPKSFAEESARGSFTLRLGQDQGYLMSAWQPCKAFLIVQRTHRRGAQGNSAFRECQHIVQHLPGCQLDRELRRRNLHNFSDPHRAPLQVNLPYFITNNFATPQRLELALQPRHRVLENMPGLDPAVCTRVQEHFVHNGKIDGDNGEETRTDAIWANFIFWANLAASN
jgi:hypothetical protein